MKTIASFLLCLAIYSCLLGQGNDTKPYMGPGAPLIQYFSPLSYQAAPQNAMITQTPNGVLYVGNQDGVLEYDGATWRLIPLSNRSPVKAIAVDPEGTVYVAGQAEIGFLANDSTGLMQYRSLVAELPEKYQDFSFVERIVPTTHGVYFQSFRNIFHWDQSEMRVWDSEFDFFLGGGANDHFFTQEITQGLRQSQGDSSDLVLEDAPLREMALISIIALPDPDSSTYLLLFTNGDLMLFEDGKPLRPFPVDPKVSQYLLEKQANQMILLSDGRLAFPTIQAGVLIVNQAGQIDQVIDKKAGLRSNEASWVYEDLQGGLWIATSNGLARVELDQAITYYGPAQGLEAGAIQMLQHQQQLYVGNSLGLFRLFENASSSQAPFFAPVPKVPGGFAEMVHVEDEENIFIGTVESLGMIFEDGTPSNSMQFPITQLHTYQKQAGHLWMAFPDAIGLLSYDSIQDGWFFMGDVPAFTKSTSSIVEDQEGTLWAGYGYDAVARIDIPNMETMLDTAHFDEHFEIYSYYPPLKVYAKEAGVPSGANQVYHLQGQLWLGTNQGLKRYDPSLDRFVIEPALGSISMDTTYAILHLSEAIDGTVWIAYEKAGEYGLGRLTFKEKEPTKWESKLLRRLMNPIAPTTLYADPDQAEVLWIGTGQGIYRYDGGQDSATSTQIPSLIRELKTNGQTRSLDSSLVLPYADNDLQFGFALPNMSDPTRSEYQFRLIGFEEDWSAWSKASTKGYTNLSEGDYTFVLRAKDSNGLVHETASYSFTILPPWYRTWWARGLWSILFIGIFIGLAMVYNRWRTNQLLAQNEALEETVQLRTEEVLLKNQELAQTLDTLKNTQDQLIMQEKMASLGQMTAGIAHEIKNPLNFINNFSIVAEELAGEFKEDLDSYLQSKAPEDLELLMETVEGLKQNTGYIREHGERATEIVRGMMDHARGTDGERVATDINQLLEEATHLAHLSFQAQNPDFPIVVKKELASDLPPISLNRQEIQRVILNLVGNACNALEQKAKEAKVEFKPQLALRTHLENQKLVIEIQDNGIGISESVKEKIFQPFFTTKATGQGHVGLGLSISYDIITQGYQGSISCESEEGLYTKFLIKLPVRV
ncbi:MAG: ATP-binding protein [Bacteroidota bacterium]